MTKTSLGWASVNFDEIKLIAQMAVQIRLNSDDNVPEAVSDAYGIFDEVIKQHLNRIESAK
jgi:hypothetical protein